MGTNQFCSVKVNDLPIPNVFCPYPNCYFTRGLMFTVSRAVNGEPGTAVPVFADSIPISVAENLCFFSRNRSRIWADEIDEIHPPQQTPRPSRTGCSFLSASVMGVWPLCIFNLSKNHNQKGDKK